MVHKISISEFIERAGDNEIWFDGDYGEIGEALYRIANGKIRREPEPCKDKMTSFLLGICDGRVYGILNGEELFQMYSDDGYELVTISGFVDMVRSNRPEYPADFVEGHARKVFNGEYNSIAPATGVYWVRRCGIHVIASIRPLHPEHTKRLEMECSNEEITVELIG